MNRRGFDKPRFIGSEAKNLVHFRSGSGNPRSFVEPVLSGVEGLRMTAIGEEAEKIDSNHESTVHPRWMKIVFANPQPPTPNPIF